MNRPRTVVRNPLTWSSLTWLVFLTWLAPAVLVNLGATVFRDGSGARVDHCGWPLTHTKAWYPASSASTTHQETSYLFAIVDVLAVVSVQLSIIIVAPHWPRRTSVRALLLLTTLVATFFAMGRVIVADKVLSAIAMDATDAFALCLYFLPLAVWCGAFVVRWFGVRRFSDRLLPVAVVGALVGLLVLSAWEYIPGTLCCDANGFPHGTGKKEYYYDSGALMIEEWYRAGVQTKTTWYRPDGTHIATSASDKETGRVGLFLRQNGSIRRRVRFRYSPSENLYLAHGTATDFAPDGSVVKTVEYRDGVPAEGQ